MKDLVLILGIMTIPFLGTTQEPLQPVKVQCQGKKADGMQCSRKQVKTYCWQHDPAALRCGVPTKGGTPCKRIVKTAGQHCSQHQ